MSTRSNCRAPGIVLLLVAILGWCAPPLHAQSKAPARTAIEAQYARIVAAFESGKLESLRDVMAADFTTVDADGDVRTLEQHLEELTTELKQAKALTYATDIDSMASNRAIASVRARARVGGEIWSEHQKQAFRGEVQTYDRWALRKGTWRLVHSTTLSLRSWIDGHLARQAQYEPPPTPAQRQRLLADLKAHAVPFDTVLPVDTDADLAELGRIVGDARVVALGESSHGTAEQFRAKHRFVRYLVEKKGFSVFAIEGGWGHALAADSFIKTGAGDPRPVLQSVWETEEVRDMLAWMRAHNLARGQEKPLSFAGFDCQQATVEGRIVVRYLAGLDAAASAAARAVYADIEASAERARAANSDEQPLAERAKDATKLVDGAKHILQLVESYRGRLADGSASRDLAAHAARVTVQFVEFWAAQGSNALRDQFMAENARWLLETGYPGEKIVLWAHNGHVGTATFLGIKSQGMYLREWLGRELVVIGFGLHHGSVRARRMRNGVVTGGYLPMDIPPGRPASVEGLFNTAGLGRFILDLRTLPIDGALATWLAKPRPHRTIGCCYDPDHPGSTYISASLGERYDAYVFIADSTAAKPWQRGDGR